MCFEFHNSYIEIAELCTIHNEQNTYELCIARPTDGIPGEYVSQQSRMLKYRSLTAHRL